MKSDDDVLCDAMIFGQLFVDELEDVAKSSSLFKQGVKFWSKKLMEEFGVIAKDVHVGVEGSKRSVLDLYALNYDLLHKVNRLSLEEKLKLTENFDEVVSCINSL